jgi:DNA-binding transcriptional LysR family regulator
MEPTPLGEELVQPIRSAIDAVHAALGHRRSFDPATATRSFRIAMTDISQIVLLPGLWARLRMVAPGVNIEVVSPSADSARMLEAGEADLALGFMPQLESGFYQQALFRQHWVCIAGIDHPRVRGSLGLAQYEAEDHAVVTTSGTGHHYFDRELARLDIKRRVVLRVPNFLGVAFVVAHTDVLVTIPARLAEMLSGHGGFRIHPLPFDVPQYSVKQYWHERFHHDPANRWLRGVIRDLLGEAAAEGTGEPEA